MNIFNKIPLLKPKRNVFNLGFENRLSTDLFRLTPICIKEALPDDVFKIRSELFARVMPALNAPIMQRFNIRTYWFFVPTRIIWDDFEKWINPKSGTSDIVAPRVQIDADVVDSAYIDMVGPKSLADYLGLNFGLSLEDQSSALAFQLGMKKIFTVSEGGTSVVKDIEFSSLPFRAYQQIYNDWFIDLNNVDVAEFSKGSGVEEIKLSDFEPGGEPYNNPIYQKLLKIRHRAWEHDYFTSAMPDPQRGPDVMAFDGSDSIGDIDVTISGAGTQVVVANGDVTAGFDVSIGSDPVNRPNLSSINSSWVIGNWQALGFASQEAASEYATDANIFAIRSSVVPDWDNIRTWAPGVSLVPVTYVVDGRTIQGYGKQVTVTNGSANVAQIANKLSATASASPDSVPGVTVEELRVRMQMQSFLERNEIGGSRYTEMLFAHWGVKDPDGRLQRAEFIGGWKQPLMINEVSQTSAPTDEDPLGQYAGQGTSSSVSKFLRYRVPEHGFIVGLMCIVPRTGYFQGIEKMWKRFDRLDYYWPSFAHLGEQEVRNFEVLFSAFDPDGTFGYQQRYAEYKASNDQVHGDMKGSLGFWHGARVFATPENVDEIPKLSGEFTTPSGPGQDGIDRIFPVLSSEVPIFNSDHFVVDIYNHILASRRMPKFVTPRNGS